MLLHRGHLLHVIQGSPAVRGTASGQAELFPGTRDMSPGAIVVAIRTTPELIIALMSASGLILARGGILAHAVNLCRFLRIPCVVGISDPVAHALVDAFVELDGVRGIVHARTKDLELHRRLCSALTGGTV